MMTDTRTPLDSAESLVNREIQYLINTEKLKSEKAKKAGNPKDAAWHHDVACGLDSIRCRLGLVQ